MTKSKPRDLIVFPRSENALLASKRLEQIKEEAKKMATFDGPRQLMEKEVLNVRRSALRAAERSLKYGEKASPSLFISYSGLGFEYATLAKKKAIEYGFSIKTGFDNEVDIGIIDDGPQDPTLPELIMSRIISSTFFLGIWTSDFHGENYQGRDGRGNTIESIKGYIPSVWMPFELGIAAAHNLKIRLLVQEGTHRNYYEKPLNLKPNLLFSPANFPEKLDAIMKYFDGRLKNQIGAGA